MFEPKLEEICKIQAKLKSIKVAIKFQLPISAKLDELRNSKKELNFEIKRLEDELFEKVKNNENVKKLREEKILVQEKLAKLVYELYNTASSSQKGFETKLLTKEGPKYIQGGQFFQIFINGTKLKNSPYQPKLFEI